MLTHGSPCYPLLTDDGNSKVAILKLNPGGVQKVLKRGAV